MLRFLVAIAMALFAGGGAMAQTSYPDRPIRLIVGFAPGGATDVASRLLAAELTKILKQQVVVENKVGGAGMIGMDAVAKAKPDGYTIGVAGIGATAITPYLDPNASYIPTRDLDVIGKFYYADFILVARPDLPQKSLKELLDYAKANPGKVTFGSVGITSPNQIYHEELARLAGAKMLHIPYPGEAPIVPALMTSQIDIAYLTPQAAESFVRDGKLKLVAAGGPERSHSFPDLPTVTEQMGYSGYTSYSWTVLVAPKGTPANIIARLNSAMNEVLAQPAFSKRLEGLGITVAGGTAEQAQAFLADEVARFRELVKLNNIKRE